MKAGMESPQTTESRPQISIDRAIGNYREVVFFRFAMAITAVLTPFVVYALYQGFWLMGMTGLLIVVVLVVDAMAIRQRKPVPIPYVVLFIPILVTLGIAIPERGVIAVFWAYPSLLLAHFILEKRTANIVSVALLLVVIPFSFSELGTPISLRLLATLLLTIIFANIFSSVILRIQKYLHELATMDPLTGAYNRRYMDNRIASLVSERKSRQVSVSMLMLDLDHFKQVNDELGHDVGDRVLKEVITCVKDILRNGDEVFRVGGEEFVILLPKANQEVAETIAENIRCTVAGHKILDDREVTVSIGGCELGEDESPDAWLKRSDEALYEAKEGGRNRVVISSSPVG